MDLTPLRFEPLIPEVQWSNHCGAYPFKVSASFNHLSQKFGEATTVDLTPLKFELLIPEVQWSNHCGPYPFKV